MGQILGLLSQIMGVGGFITAVVMAILAWRKFRNEDRKTGAEAGKLGAETGKLGAETEVAVGGMHIQLSDSAIKRMAAAEAKADAAEEEARSFRAEADKLRRDRDNDHELIQDLRRDVTRLRDLILACPQNGGCPVGPELRRFPDLLSRPDAD